MHSVSPSMHNAAFAAAGIDAVYLPLPAVDADDFLAFGRAHRDQRRERDDSSQGLVVRSRRRRRRDRPPHRRHQHHPRRRRQMAGGNTDVSGFLHPLLNHVELERPARGGSRRRRSRAGGRRGAGVEWVHRAGPRAQSRASGRDRGAGLGGRGTVAARAGQLGSARQLHADRHASATSTTRRCRAEQLTGRVVYDLVYNPPIDATAARGGGARMSHDWRPRHAGGAGTRTVSVVDRGEPPAGVMREAALKRLAEFMRDENHVV